MTSGQTSLSITEIPFIYSIVQIVVIGGLGKTDLETLIIPGIFGGVVGTFMVIYHPIQRQMDKWWKKRVEKLVDYKVYGPPSASAKKEAGQEIDKAYLELSLGTTSIKYEKDKIVGTFYFLTILSVLAASFGNPTFVKLVNLEIHWVILILIGLGVMMYLTSRIQKNNLLSFATNLQLNALYLQIQSEAQTSTALIAWLDVAGRALDMNNWVLVKESIDKIIRSRYGIQ